MMIKLVRLLITNYFIASVLCAIFLVFRVHVIFCVFTPVLALEFSPALLEPALVVFAFIEEPLLRFSDRVRADVAVARSVLLYPCREYT